MGRLKLVLLALALAGLSLGAVACGDDDSGGDGGGGGETSLDLTIGDIIPLTGDLADFGPPGEKAADLAVDQINAAIEEVGSDHTVTIQHEDEQTKPDAAVSAARKLVDEGASCIAGAWASSDSIPVARSVSIREGVLQISPASTSSELTGLEDDGLLNRTPPADNLQGPVLASFVAEQLGGAEGTTVAVGGRNDSYGEGLTGAFIDAWEADGGTVAGDDALLWDPEQPSYNSEAQDFVSEDPDGYVIVDFPETYIKVGPALARTGTWDPAKTFVTDGLISGSLVEEPANKAFTEGIRGTAPGTPTKGESSEAFDKLFTSSEPKDVDRQTFDGQNFDAVILCYLAAVAAGSTDGQDMADALQDVTGPPGDKFTWEQLPDAIEALQNGDDIDYVGAAGEIDLDDNGDPQEGVYDTLQNKGGEFAPAGPQIDAATQEPTG
jgi:ABC-type branched-subunit amino acid transport system substrate-binding protein